MIIVFSAKEMIVFRGVKTPASSIGMCEYVFRG
jgi:hypothetical protein